MASSSVAAAQMATSAAWIGQPRRDALSLNAPRLVQVQVLRGKGHCVTRAAASAENGGAAAEPKWKQKLAAAEAHAEETRQATLRVSCFSLPRGQPTLVAPIEPHRQIRVL